MPDEAFSLQNPNVINGAPQHNAPSPVASHGAHENPNGPNWDPKEVGVPGPGIRGLLHRNENVRRPGAATQNIALEGGSHTQEINLSAEARHEVIRRLTNRSRQATELRQNQQKLNDIDKMVLRPGFLGRLQAGDLIEEDLALAWYELNEELVQKEIAAGVMMVHEPARFEGIRNLPRIGKLIGDPSTAPTGRVDAAGNLIQDPDISAYINKIGYDTQSGRKIYEDLTSLDGLRLKLEKSFYRNGFRNPILDRVRQRVRGRRLGQDLLWGDVGDHALTKTGHEFYSELNTQIQEIINERAANNVPGFIAGMSPEALHTADPLSYLTVEHLASQRALSEKARRYALEIVQGEGYRADTTAIKSRAAELRKPATPEDIAPLQEAKNKADARATETQAKLDSLKRELKKLKDGSDDTPSELLTKREAFERARNEYNSVRTTSGTMTSGEILNLQNQIDALNLGMATLTGENLVAARQQVVDLRTLRDKHVTLLREALVKKGQAELDLNNVEARISQLEGPTLPIGVASPPAPGGISITETQLIALKTSAKSAKEKLESKQKKSGEGYIPPAKEAQAKGLEKWALASERRSYIHNLQYSQKHGDEFTREGLSDTSVRSNGRIEGAERMVAHIFQTIDKTHYNPEEDRKLLSYDAMGRGIIEYFDDLDLTTQVTVRLGGGAAGPTPPMSVEDLLSSITNQKTRLENTPAKNTKIRGQLEQDLAARERALVEFALPRLRFASQMQIASFMNFLIDSGLKSAEQGNPYLSFVR